MSAIETQTKWLEINARGPEDSIRLLWNQDPNPETSRFIVEVPGPDGSLRTPELPIDEARQDFHHPNVSIHLGTLAMDKFDVTRPSSQTIDS